MTFFAFSICYLIFVNSRYNNDGFLAIIINVNLDVIPIRKFYSEISKTKNVISSIMALWYYIENFKSIAHCSLEKSLLT